MLKKVVIYKNNGIVYQKICEHNTIPHTLYAQIITKNVQKQTYFLHWMKLRFAFLW